MLCLDSTATPTNQQSAPQNSRRRELSRCPVASWKLQCSQPQSKARQGLPTSTWSTVQALVHLLTVIIWFPCLAARACQKTAVLLLCIMQVLGRLHRYSVHLVQQQAWQRCHRMSVLLVPGKNQLCSLHRTASKQKQQHRFLAKRPPCAELVKKLKKCGIATHVQATARVGSPPAANGATKQSLKWLAGMPC